MKKKIKNKENKKNEEAELRKKKDQRKISF
jgi:hypothetical protein